MNLYTFNFNSLKFIAKSLLTFLIFLICYILFVPKIFPNGGIPSNQWQGNIIKAQRYIYNSHTDVVITGSSLSARLKNNLPNTFYNLAFDGGSLSDGLEIIIKGKKNPKVVLIETNVIYRKADSKFLNSLFTPIISDLRISIPALREEYQPVTIAIKVVQSIIQPNNKYRDVINQKQEDEKDIINVWLPIQEKVYSTIPDVKDFENQITDLKDKMRILSGRGIKVVFFEIPTHSRLTYSKRNTFIRERLLQEFPSDRYKWLILPDTKEYQTSDGIHLNNISAEKYSIFLVNQLNSSINIKSM